MPAPDFYNMIARERGAPDGWRWYSLEARGGDREHGAVLMKGCIPTVITRGPRKGQPNFHTRDASTAREYVITFKDYDQRIEQWERETKLCSLCGGDGRGRSRIVLTKDDQVAIHGSDYEPCRRCKGRNAAAAGVGTSP